VRRRRGYTLLELLLVLVIIAILGILVLPSFTGGRDRRAVETQARTTVALARKARALASSEGRTYLLVVDRQAAQLRLARRREPLAEPTDEDDPELDAPEGALWTSAVPFEEAVQVESFERDGAATESDETPQIAFRASGEADDGRLVFAKDGERLAVRVDPYLGIARIEEAE
jgi:type II secretion system protein H